MSKVSCAEHGEQDQTFVCKHIVEALHAGVSRGFFWASDAGNPRPDAWCHACNERVKKTGGEWTGEAEEHLGAKLLCGGCYDVAKRLRQDSSERDGRAPAN